MSDTTLALSFSLGLEVIVFFIPSSVFDYSTSFVSLVKLLKALALHTVC